METLVESTISGVIDTNILVYAHVDDAEDRGESSSLLGLVRTGQQAVAVTPQILMEFYAVITDARRVTDPYTAAEASAEIKQLLAMPGMYLLPFPADLIDRTQALLERCPVTGPAVFDVQIVATMLGNGVTRIYTFDRKGFEPFEEIEAMGPIGKSEPVTIVWREPPEELSILMPLSRRISKTVLFSVLFRRKPLDW